MKNWGVEQHPFVVLGGGCHATVRGERGAVSLSGTPESVSALVEALTNKTERPQADAAGQRRVVLRAVLSDGKGGSAAMTFDFPPGHELTVSDVAGIEEFASRKFGGATLIATAWHWLPVPEDVDLAAVGGGNQGSTEEVSEMADPPPLEGAADAGRRNLRAVPPPALARDHEA